MKQTRASGVLLHVSSLWGEYSCGAMGKEAHEFIDFLSDCGFSYWQTLPFCLPDGVGSPYSSFGAFSLNPYFIDLEALFSVGLLTKEELDGARQTVPWAVEFSKLSAERFALLQKAAERFQPGKDYEEFFEKHRQTDRFCTFMALRKANGGAPFREWTTDREDESEKKTWRFISYIFYRQWQRVKEYAHQKGVRVIGDIPIYVSMESADVWANRECFQLDERLRPTNVAGVPPDYFCPEGQLWGNPLYNWRKMEEDGFSFWRDRVSFMCEFFDELRIDHFRGVEAYYSIPGGAKNAIHGKWRKGPGMKLVNAVKEAAGESDLIAEDLGVSTPGLKKLLQQSGMPGMRVFQFGFPTKTDNEHLPHNYVKNCVAYTGTHDNNTLLGTLWDMDESTRREMLDYCNCMTPDGRWDRPEVYEAIMKTLLESVADRVILPMQDLLMFGADTRMNTPGVAEGNWTWRVMPGQLNLIDRKKWAYFNKLCGRAPKEEEKDEPKEAKD